MFYPHGYQNTKIYSYLINIWTYTPSIKLILHGGYSHEIYILIRLLFINLRNMVSDVHELLQLFKDYLSSLPIFIISFYFVTAQPSGHFIFILNPLNLLLLFSYLITYPVALH